MSIMVRIECQQVAILGLMAPPLFLNQHLLSFLLLNIGGLVALCPVTMDNHNGLIIILPEFTVTIISRKVMELSTI